MLFERVNNDSNSITYASGLTGLAYMFNFLNENQLINEYEIDESLEFLDETIVEYGLKPIVNYEDIDFLHGKLGAANYLLRRLRYNKNIEKKVVKIFENIAHKVLASIADTNKVSTLKSYDDYTHRTNCGLAHGHISTIIIFSKFLKIFPKNQLIRHTLNESVKCVMGFKSEDDSKLAMFPSIAVNRQTAFYNIPLGWCYGDQTASLGLYRASQVLQNKELETESRGIALRTLRRNTFEIALSSLSDAGFCHGASSLAYLHKKWFKITGEKMFIQLYNDFIRIVMDKGNNPKGVAGYRKYMGNNEYEKAIGLLDGIIGIGIVLADYILDDDNKLFWDQFFILDY